MPALQPFATPSDLASWLPPGTEPDDAPRQLQRATERVLEYVTSGYSVDALGAPADPDIAEALADATCAQVEQWLEVGEENDIAGYARSTSISGPGLTTSQLPPRLAPRAAAALDRVGLRTARGW